MIGYLRGRVIEVTPESVILDVNGVGYELQCSTATIDAIGAGEEAVLQVHTHVREDAITLYGFASSLEKNLFLSLVKVNGVGPKLAVKALGAGPLANFVEMIEAGDIKGLTALPKVGKKTAEQIILALRGKLAVTASAVPSVTGGVEAKVGQGSRRVKPEIVSALVNLGFRLQEVERVVEEIGPELSFEDGLRRSLQSLTGPV